MKTTILIPAYRPEEKVLALADGLKEQLQDETDSHILVVDDGSGREFAHVFERLEEKGCEVLHCAANGGKGAALKKGIDRIRTARPDTDYIITADCDGQHRPEDIAGLMREASAYTGSQAPLILGVRDFHLPDVPKRSRYGNAISSFYFLLSTGKKCPDTQTGLRAIPSALFSLAEQTEGEQYEYEMNFLSAAAREVPLRFREIRTVYEDGNRCSHFRPVADSLRIFRTPLRFAASSLLSAGADLLLFSLLVTAGTGAGMILAATVAARLVSGGLNFLLNRRWSFKAQGADRGSAAGQGIRYFILFCGIMLCSWFFVTAFQSLPIPLTAVKALVDVDLAVASYYLQQRWVFRERKSLPHFTSAEAGGVI